MKSVRRNILFAWVMVLVCCGFFFTVTSFAQACENWMGQVESIQGDVRARHAGQHEWKAVSLGDTFCPGDTLQLGPDSRAALILRNETIMRLDQNTTVTLSGEEPPRRTLLDLIKGAAQFFSRMPRALNVKTPYVNAAVEGTEFYILVTDNKTSLSIFEGRVLASNSDGRLTLASGESGEAVAGQPPRKVAVARPRDAVQWALYYPPVSEYRDSDFTGDDSWQKSTCRVLGLFREGRDAEAFMILRDLGNVPADPQFFEFRASRYLMVGNIRAAADDIERALEIDGSRSDALALKATVAVAENRRQEAAELADNAIQADPTNSAGWLAKAYAQQADFDLEGARQSLFEAVALDPENALAWARLSEMHLSFGDRRAALEAAQKAVSLNPELSRTQTVLGFAALSQIDTDKAMAAFQKAIALDQADPLPRLGLGLAMIRDGELAKGRRQIEIAAALDPGSAIIRSYMGKAYYEEKRDKLAATQFDIAQELDPNDPTPYLYEAIQKQSLNDPVGALRDLQTSIALNDNRAVYRSRLQLDEDLASRNVSQARIYSDLGFEQLALSEGYKSLSADPTNASAHRFLSDSYAALPRHEIARVSELLQSQLLQDFTIYPVQPQLAETNLFIPDGFGPSSPSFNEFTSLYNRNKIAFLGNSVVGGNQTFGEEAVVSGIHDRFAFSIGQYHYQTDGFRENNDLEVDIYNLFTQYQVSDRLKIQSEIRQKELAYGDPILRFDLDDFDVDERQDEDADSIQFGLKYKLKPNMDLIGAVTYQWRDLSANIRSLAFKTDEENLQAEIASLWRLERLKLISGVGYFRTEADETTVSSIPFIPDTSEYVNDEYTNLYLYSYVNYPKNIILTAGLSVDLFTDTILELERDQVNPKFGISWQVFPQTTLRSAVFRTVKRQFSSNQTIEPTNVAGFNQFFDESNGTDSWNYGLGIDQMITKTLHTGFEAYQRDLEVRVIRGDNVLESDWEELLTRAYLYWAPFTWMTTSLEFKYEEFDRTLESAVSGFSNLETYQVPMKVKFLLPYGFSLEAAATYTYQEGDFIEIVEPAAPTAQPTLPPSGPDVPSMPPPPPPAIPMEIERTDDDQFLIFDVNLRYRLPNRIGQVSLEARNLFDEKFNYQNTDTANLLFYPERYVMVKMTLNF